MIKFFKSALHNIKHKLEFWTPKHAKALVMKYGVPFFVILVVWEIIEDILFPCVAYLLGQHVNPVFYSFIPVAWIVCLHPIAVPILWSGWVYFKNRKK